MPLSCKAEAPEPPAEGEVKFAVLEPSFLEPLVLDASVLEAPEEGDALPLPAALALRMEEGPDFILDSYRNSELREAVLGFFHELTGSFAVADAVLANASKNDIAPALAFALCWEESRYNARAVNRNRNETVDRGLFQLNSSSFPKLKLEEFFDPAVNARFALSHLRWCLNAGGTEVAALAMYNAGTNRVRQAGTPKATLDYISRILKRQRKIDELFAAVSARAAGESRENGIGGGFPFKFSLLSPLGK